MFKSQVVHYDGILALVAIPPFVTQLRVEAGVLLSGKPWLSATWLSMNPISSEFLRLCYDHVIFFNSLKVTIMLDLYVSGNCVEISFFRCFEDCFPVLLVIPLYGLDTPFPWTIQPTLVLHAIGSHSIIFSHWLQVDFKPLEFWHSRLLFKIAHKLDVRSPLLSSF